MIKPMHVSTRSKSNVHVTTELSTAILFCTLFTKTMSEIFVIINAFNSLSLASSCSLANLRNNYIFSPSRHNPSPLKNAASSGTEMAPLSFIMALSTPKMYQQKLLQLGFQLLQNLQIRHFSRFTALVCLTGRGSVNHCHLVN